MGDKDFAKDNDFQHHLNDDWHIVHGLWVQIRGYLDRNLLRLNWKTTPQLLTLTNDDAWHDLDVTAYTSAKCTAVILAVRWTTGGRWANFYTRLNGSSADYEGIAGFSYHASGPLDVLGDNAGCQIIQKVDADGIFEYKLAKEGTFDVYLVGYWDTAA
jgi:hypothetical protein